ncbi:MAG: outer membrane beta-barrel protein [Desulfamplus sp.]|nr:outer membrane beta-barrel protein [Desulfamplus sp.]
MCYYSLIPAKIDPGWGIYCFIIAVCSLALTPLSASGETLFLEPQISIEQEYNDNILFEHDNPQQDYIGTISPAFSVKQKTPRLDSDLRASLDAIFYKDYDELNSVDKHGSASVDYRLTERLKIGGSAGYLEDSRSDREIDDTGLTIAGEREQIRGGLSGQYQFSEITNLDFTAGYTNEDIQVRGNENNDTLRAQFSLSRNISKLFRNTTALFDISYMNYQSESPFVRELNFEDLPDDILVVIVDPQEGSAPSGLIQNYISSSDYDVWNITAGFSRQMTERLSFFLKTGASCLASVEDSSLSITSADTTLYSAQSSVDGGTNWGWLLFSGISYTGLYDRIDANISRDVQTASGLNGTTERSAISLKYTRKISEKLSTRLSGTCYLNQSDRVSRSDIDELTLSGIAGMTYDFSRMWRGSLNWNYIRVEERANDLYRDRNRVYATVVRNFSLN